MTTVDFHGEHQAGIVTSAQANLHFAALDVTTTDREKLRQLLKTWTDAARRMTPLSLPWWCSRLSRNSPDAAASLRSAPAILPLR